MVWKNPEGRESNLGHAVAVLRLKGRDYLVDPSEPEPFARHQGLFRLAEGAYRFAEPLYGPDGGIQAYRVDGRLLVSQSAHFCTPTPHQVGSLGFPATSPTIRASAKLEAVNDFA